MTPRTPRTQRRAGAPLLTLTERDRAVLKRLGRHGILSSSQLDCDIYESATYGTRRRRRLFDAGILDVWLTLSREASIYSLTALGRRMLREACPGADVVPFRGLLNATTIQHSLLTSDATLYVEALAAVRGAHLVRCSHTDARLPLRELRLRPDAICEIATPGGSVTLCIEADLGGEPGAVLSSKLDRYASLTQMVDAVWFVTPSQVRAANIEALAVAAGLGAWVRVLTRAHVVARPVRELPERGAGALWPKAINDTPQQPKTDEIRGSSAPDSDPGSTSRSTSRNTTR